MELIQSILTIIGFLSLIGLILLALVHPLLDEDRVFIILLSILLVGCICIFLNILISVTYYDTPIQCGSIAEDYRKIND